MAGFKGFVNPNQSSSVSCKHAGQSPATVIHPGEPIELDAKVFDKLKAKGLVSKLLVKTLPKVIGAEPVSTTDTAIPPDLPDIDDHTTKKELISILKKLGQDHDPGASRHDLYLLVAQAYEELG